MTISEYLSKLGYDSSKYTIIPEPNVQPLLSIAGFQNHVYGVRDPKGVRAFGKGAKIVNIEFAKKHIPEFFDAPAEEEKEEQTPPPPPKAPAKKEEPLDVKYEDAYERSEELIKELRFEKKDEHTLKAPDGNELSMETLEEFDDFAYTKYYNSYKALTLAKPGQEKELKEAQERMAERRKPKEEEDIAKIREELESGEDENLPSAEDIEKAKESQKPQPKKEPETTKEEFLEELSKPVKKDELIAEQQAHEELEGEELSGKTADEVEEEDLQGEIVDATTIRTEAPKSQLEKFTEPLKKSAGGFFSNLDAFGFQQLTFTINKMENGKLNLIVKPQNFSGDPAYDQIKPLSIVGTVEELDKDFFSVIAGPMEQTASMMSNAKDYIEALAEQEKKTKAKEEEQKKITDLVEKAKKYHDDKSFDAGKPTSVSTATKKWNAVLELDPENKDAKEGMDKLKEQTKKAVGTLDL